MTRRTMGDVPDDAMVPLKMAHLIVGKSSSALYRWVNRGLLRTEESPDGWKVRVGDVRELTRTVRHGGRRVKGKTVDGNPLDTP